MSRTDEGLSVLRVRASIPRSVEVAMICCLASAFVAGFLAFIALVVLLPRDGAEHVLIDAVTGGYLLLIAGIGVAVCGMAARRGRAWPRWALIAIAVTELLFIGRIPLMWLAFVGVLVAALALWSPSARSYSRSVQG